MADPVTEFEQYRQELLAALGDDDPVAVLRESLEEVTRLVADAAPRQLNQSMHRMHLDQFRRGLA